MSKCTRAVVFGCLAPLVCYGGCCAKKGAVAPVDADEEADEDGIELTNIRTRDGSMANVWQVSSAQHAYRSVIKAVVLNLLKTRGHI